MCLLRNFFLNNWLWENHSYLLSNLTLQIYKIICDSNTIMGASKYSDFPIKLWKVKLHNHEKYILGVVIMLPKGRYLPILWAGITERLTSVCWVGTRRYLRSRYLQFRTIKYTGTQVGTIIPGGTGKMAKQVGWRYFACFLFWHLIE